MTVWRLLGHRAVKIRKDAVKMVEATVQLGGDITKESEEMQNRGVERLTRS